MLQALLQHQVKDEQQRQRQATAELRRLQLSNPRLDASAIHAIAGLDGADQQVRCAMCTTLTHPSSGSSGAAHSVGTVPVFVERQQGIHAQAGRTQPMSASPLAYSY